MLGGMSAISSACEAPWTRVEAPAMTRCECAGVPFVEVERRIREEGLTVEEVSRRSGCGRTCTACLPDLKRFLADRR